MLYFSVLVRLIQTCTAATEPGCQSIPDFGWDGVLSLWQPFAERLILMDKERKVPLCLQVLDLSGEKREKLIWELAMPSTQRFPLPNHPLVYSGCRSQ